MSWREAWVFVRHLPADSWTQTALRDRDDLDDLRVPESGDQKFGPWALQNYQIAELIDSVNVLAYKVHISGQLKPDMTPPQPAPRPGLKVRLAAAQRKQPEAAVLYLHKLRAPKQATGG